MQSSTMRRLQNLLFLATIALLSTKALAFEREPFTEARFKALQAQGQLVLIDISATWCPTCKRQKAILDEYQQENPDSGLHILNVDFDDQKEWVTFFKAPRQSTLVLYSGKEQVWFSVAETRKEKIVEALNASRAKH